MDALLAHNETIKNNRIGIENQTRFSTIKNQTQTITSMWKQSYVIFSSDVGRIELISNQLVTTD